MLGHAFLSVGVLKNDKQMKEKGKQLLSRQ